MKKVFAEMGFGNGTFLSTEFEEVENEYRIPKFVWPTKIVENSVWDLWYDVEI